MPEIMKTRLGTLTYLAPSGNCSSSEEVAELKEAFEKCLGAREVNIALDLERVPALSGQVLETLLDAQERLSCLGGELSVINASPLLRDVFLVTGLEEYVKIVELH